MTSPSGRGRLIKEYRKRFPGAKPKTSALKYLPDGTIRADRKTWQNHPATNEVVQNAIGSRGHAAIS
jgi:hypothetical protein